MDSRERASRSSQTSRSRSYRNRSSRSGSSSSRPVSRRLGRDENNHCSPPQLSPPLPRPPLLRPPLPPLPPRPPVPPPLTPGSVRTPGSGTPGSGSSSTPSPSVYFTRAAARRTFATATAPPRLPTSAPLVSPRIGSSSRKRPREGSEARERRRQRREAEREAVREHRQQLVQARETHSEDTHFSRRRGARGVLSLMDPSGNGSDETANAGGEGGAEAGGSGSGARGTVSSLQGFLRRLGAFEELLGSSIRNSSAASSLRNLVKSLQEATSSNGDGENEAEILSALQNICQELCLATEDTIAALDIRALVSTLTDNIKANHSPERMLLAARALTHLFDVAYGVIGVNSALNSVTVALENSGTVSVLCDKLLSIEYIDLAEQALVALEKLSRDPVASRACLEGGAVTAATTYLDFFPTGVQRTALKMAANICAHLPPGGGENTDAFSDVVATLTNILLRDDGKLVELAAKCIEHILASVAKSSEDVDEKMSSLCTTAFVENSMVLLRGALGGNNGASVVTSLGGGGAAVLGNPIIVAIVAALTAATSKSRKAADSFFAAGLPRVAAELLSLGGLASPGSPVSPAGSSAIPTAAILALVDELFPPFHQLAEDIESAKRIRLYRVQSSGKIKADTSSRPAGREQDMEEAIKALFGLVLEIYKSAMVPSLRQRCLGLLFKQVQLAPSSLVEDLAKETNVISLLTQLVGSAARDPEICLYGIALSDALLAKNVDSFPKLFHKEGLAHMIEKVSSGAFLDKQQPSSSKEKSKGEDSSSTPSSQSRRSSRNKGTLAQSKASTPARSSSPTAESVANSAVKTPPLLRSMSGKSKPEEIMELSRSFLEKHSNVIGQSAKMASMDSLNRLSSISQRLDMGDSDADAALVELFDALEDPDGVSTFEIIQSAVYQSLKRYLLGGSDHKSSISDMPRRLTKFLTGARSRRNLSNLINKLLSALEANERLPLLLFQTRFLENPGSGADTSAALGVLTQPLKLKLTRDGKEKELTDYSSNVVLIEPLATLKAVEDFLYPRVSRNKAKEGSEADKSDKTADTDMEDEDKDNVINDNIREVADEDPEIYERREDADKQDAKAAVEDEDGSDEENDQDDDDDDNDRLDLDAEDNEGHEEIEMFGDGDRVTEVKLPEPNATDSNVEEGSGSESLSARAKSPCSFKSALVGSVKSSKKAEKQSRLQFEYKGQIVHGLKDAQLVDHNRNCSLQMLARPRRNWDDVYTITYYQCPPDSSAEIKDTDSDQSTDGSIAANQIQSILEQQLGKLENLADKIQDSGNTVVCDLLMIIGILHTTLVHLPRLRGNEHFEESLISEFHSLPMAVDSWKSSKLSAKALRQLSDVLAVASGAESLWSSAVADACPYLLSFEVRRRLLVCRAFGIARTLHYLQDAADSSRGSGILGMGGTAASRRGARVARLQRKKVRVARDRILESAALIASMTGESRAVLEIEFYGEVGTGLGPTLEFYSLTAHAFHDDKLGMWANGRVNGLFPRPYSCDSSAIGAVLERFRLLGRLSARAMLDGRLLDVPMSEPLLRAAFLGEKLDLFHFQVVDPELYKTISKMQSMIADNTTQLDGTDLEDLGLMFTVPGYEDCELKENGAECTVTKDNFSEYVALLVDHLVGVGVERQVYALAEGFRAVLPEGEHALKAFSASEIDLLLRGEAATFPWDRASLLEALKFDHGYNTNSVVVEWFLEILVDMDSEMRQKFIQFITGATRLPVGGLIALQPPLTIVRKQMPDNSSPDKELPSVMTCANYLKLPQYSSKSIMTERMIYAIEQGQGSFHLS